MGVGGLSAGMRHQVVSENRESGVEGDILGQRHGESGLG